MKIDSTKEFYIPALVNAEGQFIGPLRQGVPKYTKLGTVVFLFTTEEKLRRHYETMDQNQAFMDILERAPEGTTSEDLNLDYVITTVQDLLPILHDYGVGNLWVDPEGPGGYSRIYPTPPPPQ